MRAALLVVLLSLSSAAMAEPPAIPITEQEFVDSMQKVKPEDVRNQFGDPEKITEIRDQRTGELHGSVWHYHHLNTGVDGNYYKTTMLDIVDDAVITVTFSDTLE